MKLAPGVVFGPFLEIQGSLRSGQIGPGNHRRDFQLGDFGMLQRAIKNLMVPAPAKSRRLGSEVFLALNANSFRDGVLGAPIVLFLLAVAGQGRELWNGPAA